MNLETIRNMWRDLVVGNPMLIETRRVRRRFLTLSGKNASNAAVFIIGVLAYIFATFIVLSGKGWVQPSALIMLQTSFFCFFGPAILYGTIAGEREKRSWDLLLVAPITHAQIVVGKFMGAAMAILFAAAAGLVPVAISAVLYETNRVIADRSISLYHLFLSELVSISFGFLVSAITIFFSARVKRPLAALGTVYAILGVGLIAIPAVLSMDLQSDKAYVSTLFYAHPYVAQFAMMRENGASDSSMSLIPAEMYGWPHVLIYLGLTIVALTWATKTLIFADNDVKFIPQGEPNARS